MTIRADTERSTKIIQSQLNLLQNKLNERLKNKVFWIWSPQKHNQKTLKQKGDCCFNHIIGLPKEEGKKN